MSDSESPQKNNSFSKAEDSELNEITQRDDKLPIEKQIENVKEKMIVFKKKFIEMKAGKEVFAEKLQKDEEVLHKVSNDFKDLTELLAATIDKLRHLNHEDEGKPTASHEHGHENVKQSEVYKLVTDFDFILQQLKESSEKLFKVVPPDWDIKNSISNKMKFFNSNFKVCNESLDDFIDKAKVLLHINNLKNFSMLGIAKFGKPEKPRHERACKRCHQNTNPRDLPSTFHTTLECPQRGYDRVQPAKKEKGFVIIKSLSKTPSKSGKYGGHKAYYPVEVIWMKAHVYDKKLDVYNYYTADGYSLESYVKYWKQTGEWISDEEYYKSHTINQLLYKWTNEFYYYYYPHSKY